MSKNSNIIAVTMGDPSGVGTEIAIRAKIKKIKKPNFFIIHDPDFVKKIIKKMKSKLKVREINSPSEVKKLPKNYLAVLPIKISKSTQLGKKNLSNTKSILKSIDLAVKLAKNGEVAAIVTNPINKDVIGKKVKNFRGHTEYLAKKDRTNDQLMVMMNKNMKTIPLTTHIAVNKVSSKINKKNIIKAIINANLSLRNDFKIKKPRIAVTALNPHAGDGGLIGDDEMVKILPAINYCKKKKISVEGPLPADSAFIKNNQNKYDIFICMFHDQALIPVKMISFDETVNYTAGLSFVRTSPDHGTGLDIAKKFIASPNSLIAALKSASKIAQARRK